MDKSSAYPPPSTPPGAELSFMSGTTVENTPPHYPPGLSSGFPTQPFSVLSGISALVDPALRGLGSDDIGTGSVPGTATTGTNASAMVPLSSSAMDGEEGSMGERGQRFGVMEEGRKGTIELEEAESGVSNEGLSSGGGYLIRPGKEAKSGEKMSNGEAQETAINSSPPISKGQEEDEGEAGTAKSNGKSEVNSSPPNIQLRFSSLGQGTLDPSTNGTGIDDRSLPDLNRSVDDMSTSPISTSQIEQVAEILLRRGGQNIDNTVDEGEETLSNEYSRLTHPEGAGELFAGQLPGALKAPQQLSTDEWLAIDLAATSELDIPPPSYVHNAPETEIIRSSAIGQEEDSHKKVGAAKPDKEDISEKANSTSAMLPPPIPILTQESEGIDEIELPKLAQDDAPLNDRTKRVEIPDSEVDEDEELSSSSRGSEQYGEKTNSRPGEEHSSAPNLSITASAGIGGVAEAALRKVWPRCDRLDTLPKVEVKQIAPIEGSHALKQDDLASPRVKGAVSESDLPLVDGPLIVNAITEILDAANNYGVDGSETRITDSSTPGKSNNITVVEAQRGGTEIGGRNPDVCKIDADTAKEKSAFMAERDSALMSASKSEIVQHMTIAPASEDKPKLPGEETSTVDENLNVAGATKLHQHTFEKKETAPSAEREIFEFSGHNDNSDSGSEETTTTRKEEVITTKENADSIGVSKAYLHTAKNKQMAPVPEKETPRSSEHASRVEVPDSESGSSPEAYHAEAELSVPGPECVRNAGRLEQSVDALQNVPPYQACVSMDSIETPNDESMVIEETAPRDIPDSTEPVPSLDQSSDVKNSSKVAEKALPTNTIEAKLLTTNEVSEATGVPAADELDVPPSSSQSSIQQPSTIVDIAPTAPPSPVLTRKRKSPTPEVLPSVNENIPSSPPAPPKKKQKKGSDKVEAKEVVEEKDVVKNKDELLMDELRAMKVASIQARNSSIETEIARVHAKLESVTAGLEHPAGETLKTHIHLLHHYNDIRDVGQGLIGMIADNRGVRIGELYDEFGVGLQD